MHLTLRDWRPLVILSLSGILLSCGDGPTEPPDPVATKLGFVTPPPSETTSGEVLSPQPVIQLQDAAGAAVAKSGVVVTATLDGGTATGGTATTGSNGRATFSGLALSASVGSRTLHFNAPNLAGLTHGVEVTAGATALISANSAVSQSSIAGLPVPQPPSVKVADAAGNPAANVVVTFRVVSGAGTIEGASQLTGPDGTATVSAWLLGLAAGSNSLVAQASGVANVVTFTATGVLIGSATADTTNYHVGLPGSLVSIPPAVRIFENGMPKSGALVRFRFANGTGTIEVADAISDAAGLASAGGWTLGEATGAYVLVAEAPGYSATPFRFRAWAVATMPAKVIAYAGDNQILANEEYAPVFPAVRAQDAAGAPLVGFPVTFEPLAGPIDHELAVTDGNGVATTGRWWVPQANGTYQVVAHAPPLDGSPVQITAIRSDQVPGHIEQVSEPITAPVGTTVFGVPRIRVTTVGGVPLAGVSVTFAVTSGGGTLGGSATKVTDASGEVAPDSWTLGTTSGPQGISATATPLPPLGIGATSVAGPPQSIVPIFGDNQSGPVYNPLPNRVGIRAIDAYGNGSGGTHVDFEVSLGGGRVANVFAPTGPTGEASARWFLGDNPGPNQLTVRLVEWSSVTPLNLSATATTVSSPFNIEILTVGVLETEQLEAVEAAVARWRTIIRSELSDISLQLAADECTPGGNQPAIDQVVDDVLIMVDFSPIDGRGGVLGSAGPCVLRSGSSLPVFGTITIDGADAADLATSGELRDVILHEMGHVLGIGTIWDLRNLLIGEGGSDPQYTGIAARQAYNALGGTSVNVAVENQGGAGTRDSHWRESVFSSELMTGYIGGTNNPLSKITSRSLIDLGYVIDDATADPLGFTPSFRREAEAARAKVPLRRLSERPLTGPIILVYPDGTSRKVPR